MKFLKARLESVISLCVAVVVMTIVVVASISEFRSLLQALDWFSHSQETVLALTRLQLDLTMAETGQRGYILTHQSDYLVPYNQGRNALTTRVQHLDALFVDDLSQQAALDHIRPLLKEKFAEMDETIRLDKAGQLQHSLRLIRSNHGQYLMDDINGQVLEMLSRERDRLVVRNTELHHRVQRTIVFFIFGFFLTVLFLFWAFRLLANEIRGHMAAEAAARTSERQFRESEELLRTLLNNARDFALYLLDAQGRILTWTEAAERLHGFSSRDVLGGSHRLVFSQEDLEKGKPEKVLEEAVKTGRYDERTLRVRKDGTSFNAEVSIIPIYEAAGALRGFTQITRDLSERVRSEQALRQAQDQLTQLQKMDAIGRLAGGIAHDFNNLLTGILGYGEDLTATLPVDSQERGDVQEIVKAALRAAALTRQLLAFSRKQIASPRVLNLNAIVVELDKMLRRVVPENIEFTLRLAPDVGHVKADPTQIEQILMNLVLNARDAMPSGGKITIETSNVQLEDAYAMERAELVPGPYVVLSVSDTGHGMTKETQAQIFEPFFTTKPSGSGTGLGLSTVYGIVKQNAGHIFVYSNLGLGSTFKIYLPRTTESASPYRVAEAPKTEWRGHETILLVEDEPIVRNLTMRTLEKSGFRVLVANGGEQGVLLAQAQPEHAIDLLLTDVVMPGMNGPLVAQAVLKRHPKTKVLYMSGYTQNIIVHGGILKSGILLLEKPFNSSELVAKVRAVLDGKVSPSP